MDWTAVRAGALRRFTRRDSELWLVGTIHGNHWEQDVYGIDDVAAALINLEADLVMIEARAEEIAAGNETDGPPEMHVVRLLAAERGTLVAGIDHWEVTPDSRPLTTSESRDGEITRRILDALEGAASRRAAVFIGYRHLAALDELLSGRGWSPSRVAPSTTAAVFAHDGAVPMPAGLTDVFIERAGREAAAAERYRSLNPAHSAQARENAVYFAALARRIGSPSPDLGHSTR